MNPFFLFLFLCTHKIICFKSTCQTTGYQNQIAQIFYFGNSNRDENKIDNHEIDRSEFHTYGSVYIVREIWIKFMEAKFIENSN